MGETYNNGSEGTTGHAYCLNCHGSFAEHQPEDPEACGEWWPSTMVEAK